MKKISTLLLSALLSCFVISAQQGVAINTDGSSPNSSAMLDVKSTTRGFLAPRMTYAQRTAIGSPATGLMVYQTDDYLKIEKGIYVYDGTAWKRLTDLSDLTASTLWTKTGDNQYSAVDGNVGIGTSSPDSKLDVNGPLRISGGSQRLNFVTSQAGPDGGFVATRKSPGIQFIRSDNTVLGRMEYVDTIDFANFLRLHTGSMQSNDLTINSSHLVGIGTADPKAKLHIQGGTGEQLRIWALVEPIIQLSNGPLQEKKGFVQISGDNLRVGTNSGNDLGSFVVRTNGTDRFEIDAMGVAGFNNNVVMTANAFVNGNARLGTLNVGTSLNTEGYIARIGGKMICEEVKVKLRSSGWPDYVFSDKYKLPTLEELQSFIQKNKHLPNIPSAAEVEKNGIELGDMQKRMMEKIEELTLYILQLERKNQELSLRVANLENKK